MVQCNAKAKASLGIPLLTVAIVAFLMLGIYTTNKPRNIVKIPELMATTTYQPESNIISAPKGTVGRRHQTTNEQPTLYQTNNSGEYIYNYI